MEDSIARFVCVGGWEWECRDEGCGRAHGAMCVGMSLVGSVKFEVRSARCEVRWVLGVGRVYEAR